ncbi:hypothetical protein AKJ08_3345 [Vulgatibacter incomptus]|uniref:Uncharacterized protein n=2 Tax=Vulgatibacter incomptus TaxID=1391653 RepID=A0A0K1PHE3_9BACT|nr:hypothetical protein AKJ08_3345 [Vulgatibacter incomptus]
MRNAELARREKLAGELESIRIALTEIRTQLEIRNGFR